MWWVVPSLAPLVLAAPPPIQVLSAPPRAQIAGEDDSFVFIDQGQTVKVSIKGPGRLVFDIRRFQPASASANAVGQVTVKLDGVVVSDEPTTLPLERQVTVPNGLTTSARLVEVTVPEGQHLVEAEVAKNSSPALISFTPLEPSADIDLFPVAVKPKAEPKAEPAVAAPAPAAAPMGVSVSLFVGGTTHLQLGGVGLELSLGAAYAVGPDHLFALGAELGYLRYPVQFEENQPPPSNATHLVSGSLQSLPIQLQAEWRPLHGWVQPFVGVGLGVAVAFLTDAEETLSSVAPVADLHVGSGFALGPGALLVQARLLVGPAAGFSGVADNVQVGGASLQVGYRLEL
jgi:hypothetical protein